MHWRWTAFGPPELNATSDPDGRGGGGAQQPGVPEQMKERFLVAVHVLYMVGFLPSLVVAHFFGEAGPLPGQDPSALVRWSFAFYPANLLVYLVTRSMRVSVFLFVLYAQAVLVWLIHNGHQQGIEYLGIILHAVGSIHVMGKNRGTLMLVLIMAEVAVLEMRDVSSDACLASVKSMPASVLRLSMMACACLTSLLHEHFHDDAAKKLHKCMNQQMKFFALISHDLRAPLESINYVACDLLTKQLPSEMLKIVDVFHESSNHLLQLLNNILEMSRIQLGTLDLRSQRFNLASELDKLLRRTCVMAQRNNVEVLDNLVSNALKFTRKTNGFIQVKLDESPDCPDKIRVEVIDNGTGIPPDTAAQLFKCFTQLESDNDDAHGFGLGLAICKKICQAMKGHIGVESTVNKGSKFWFEVLIPVAECESSSDCDAGSSGDEHIEEREPVPPLESSSTSLPTPRRLLGKRLLVVEDSTLIQMMMGRMLSKLGCQAVMASDGTAAIELLQNAPTSEGADAFDAILCDIHMPGLDGYHTVKAIRRWEQERQAEVGEHAFSRRKDRRIPIIGMSASAINREETKCLESGMNDFLQKPPLMNKLSACLEKWLLLESHPSKKACHRRKRDKPAADSASNPPCII